MTEGSLPAGLALDTDTGVIRGTPEETVESRPVTVAARDEGGTTDDHTFALTVRRGRLVTESLPTAYIGAAYRAVLNTEHMAEPLEWDVVSGSLPRRHELRRQGQGASRGLRSKCGTLPSVRSR